MTNEERSKWMKSMWQNSKYRKKMIHSQKNCNNTGKNNSQWKNGEMRNMDGRILIYSPNHPFKNRHGYVFKSRLVMEKYLKRFLKSEEVVHHINNNPLDNRIKNLKLFKNNSEHMKYHFPKGSPVACRW